MTEHADAEIRYLLHDIVFWGSRLEMHIEGLDSQRFASDSRACDAVCWCILCIGEAAGGVRRRQPDMMFQYPELQLSKAYAMRNRLAHDYAGIDVGVVWQAATVSVPQLDGAARRAPGAT
jgi:uncharacterized protein with HEPN domain